MTARRSTRPAWALLAAGLGLAGGPAMAQDAVGGDDFLDCVAGPKMQVELGSPDEGVIEEIKVDRGDLVAQGQVLVVLDSKLQAIEVEAARIRAKSDATVRSARARLEFRRTETKRTRKLHDKKIVARKILEQADIERALAELELETATTRHKLDQVELAKARERLARRSIASPIKGVVAELAMRLGEYASDQSTILTIAEIDPLHVELFAPVEIYPKLSAGTLAEVRFEAPIQGTHLATVTVVDRVFDAASRTFGVRLELPNPNYRLPAGLNCRVRFLWQGAAKN